MHIIIPKDATKEEVLALLKKLKDNKKGNLKKHFGINPNEIDGLKFQLKARQEWI